MANQGSDGQRDSAALGSAKFWAVLCRMVGRVEGTTIGGAAGAGQSVEECCILAMGGGAGLSGGAAAILGGA
jgi:hypothetical protein